MRSVLSVYLSNNGVMKPFIAAYKNMCPDSCDWLDQTGSKFRPAKLAVLASEYTEIRFVNGEYRPGLLLFCMLAKLRRSLGLSRCHVTVTWHDVTPHHKKVYDVILWILSLFSSLLSDKIIVHNIAYTGAWPLKFFKTRIMYRPLPLINYAEPVPVVIPDGLVLSGCVVFFGRIEAYKGLEGLLEAYKQYSHESLKQLLILGETPPAIKEKICDDARIFNISRYLSEPELGFILKSSCAVIMPYQHFSQSNNPYWAAIYDCSLYASSIVCRGLSEIVIDGCYELELSKDASYLDKSKVTRPLMLDIPKIKASYE